MQIAAERTNDKIIKPKVGLLKLAEQLGSVSEACRVMGYSPDTTATASCMSKGMLRRCEI